MQHVDPYNDEFFKRVAEDYPLRTNAAEWESVAKKLNSFESEAEVATRGNYKKIRLRSVLAFGLLLLPLVISVNRFYIVKQSAFHLAIRNNPDKSLQTLPVKNLAKAEIQDGEKTIKRDIVFVKEEGVVESEDAKKVQIGLPNLSAQSEAKIASELNNPAKENLKKNETTLSESKEQEFIKKNIESNSKNADPKDVSRKANEFKGFYFGGAIAPELTSVKFQPARKSFDIGLLVGYNLNKNLSIELGFMLAQKYYYTSGKYVVPNSMGPQDSKIIAVNAFNSVTEMPLTVQYNLQNERNSRIFISAGAVSYIVHKENYSYTYSKDGEEKQGRTLSNKASQNWFSNVQTSLGYEHSFNKICSVRIEPYCRVPLKGIGISDLPVTSVGVNLALIKTIK
jgi:hypothetical protein